MANAVSNSELFALRNDRQKHRQKHDVAQRILETTEGDGALFGPAHGNQNKEQGPIEVSKEQFQNQFFESADAGIF